MISTAIIIGNLFSLCAMISDSVSGTRKKHGEIMAVQIVSQFFYGASSIMLKGYSSTAQNVVAVFRNFAAMKNVKSRASPQSRFPALLFPDSAVIRGGRSSE